MDQLPKLGEKGLVEKLRDWASFVMSAMAFIISVAVAYYTTIRRVDELRLRVASEPKLSSREWDHRVVVQGGFSLVFINAGTRPIAIIGATVHFGRADQTKGVAETECTGVPLDTDLEPTIVEEKKILTKKLVLKKRPGIDRFDVRPDGNEFTLDGRPFEKQGFVTTCLTIEFTTNSQSVISKGIRLNTAVAGGDWESGSSIHHSTPILLWREVGTIFDNR